jgi:lipid A 4'-phosphatase
MRKTKRDSDRPPGWKKHLAMLALTAVLLVVIFWNGDLDIGFSRLFFDPPNAWPYADFLLWQILYEADGYLTAMLGAAAIIFIVVGLFKTWARPFVRYGVFIILSASLGAGLLVNGILKEHWGRPRPDEIVEFGGDRGYMRPWVKGLRGNGESFASGHASIAFSYIAFWFIFRRRRPRLATLSLWGTILLGSLMGLGRIIQGRHFLSDVLWAAYIPYFTCFVVYRFVWRFPVWRSRHS